MKKVITILALALISLSCSTDETTTTNTNCNCGEVIQSSNFNVVNGQGGVSVYSVIKVKNNCTDVITQSQIDYALSVGSQYCN
jgi:hypothetical protein